MQLANCARSRHRISIEVCSLLLLCDGAADMLFRRVFGWLKPSPPAADASQRDYTLWHLPVREALWLRHAESPTLAGASGGWFLGARAFLS